MGAYSAWSCCELKHFSRFKMTEKTHILVGDLDKFFTDDEESYKRRCVDDMRFMWCQDGGGWTSPYVCGLTHVNDTKGYFDDDGSFYWACSVETKIKVFEIFAKHDILIKPISVEEKKIEKHKEIIESMEKFLAELKAKYE